MKNEPHRTTFHPQSPFSIARLFNHAGLSLIVILAASVTARSQTDATERQHDAAATSGGIQKGWNEFGIWGGISFHAPALFSKSPGARFGNLGLRYGRVLAASKTVAFEYTIDVIPIALLSTRRLTFTQISPGLFSASENRKNVYGAGLAPIGLKFNFRRQKRVQPFASGTGGFLYFREDVPVPGAAQFNFTFDFGGGVQFVISTRRSFMLGYKYEHISNGFRSAINPGVDVQMVYAGYSFFK